MYEVGKLSWIRTKEARFCMQNLFQRYWEVKNSIFACCIDYEKVFNRVQHIKIDDSESQLLMTLYWKQYAYVSVPFKRGMRQGCVFSATLFNNNIFKKALNN